MRVLGQRRVTQPLRSCHDPREDTVGSLSASSAERKGKGSSLIFAVANMETPRVWAKPFSFSCRVLISCQSSSLSDSISKYLLYLSLLSISLSLVWVGPSHLLPGQLQQCVYWVSTPKSYPALRAKYLKMQIWSDHLSVWNQLMVSHQPQAKGQTPLTCSRRTPSSGLCVSSQLQLFSFPTFQAIGTPNYS